MHAWITVTGTQQLDEQEPDTIELSTRGTLDEIQEGWELHYSENIADGMDETATKITIKKDSVQIERTGGTASILILERHRRHHCHYSTPYGVLDLGVYATGIRCDLTESGGTLDFTYTLDFNGSVHSTHTVHITVQEENTTCPLS